MNTASAYDQTLAADLAFGSQELMARACDAGEWLDRIQVDVGYFRFPSIDIRTVQSLSLTAAMLRVAAIGAVVYRALVGGPREVAPMLALAAPAPRRVVEEAAEARAAAPSARRLVRRISLDLEGPPTVGVERPLERCACEHDERCVALYQHRHSEDDEPLFGVAEDALLRKGLAELRELTLYGDQRLWLERDWLPEVRAVNDYFDLLDHVAFVEEACPSLTHYQTLDLGEGPLTSFDQEKVVEDREKFEHAEWLRHRLPIVRSVGSEAEVARERALYRRLVKQHEDKRFPAPWMSPRRSTGVGVHEALRVEVASGRVEVRRREGAFHSTFFQLQQRQRELRLVHEQKKRIVQLVDALGLSIRDERVRSRIQELGLEEAESRLFDRALEAGVAA